MVQFLTIGKENDNNNVDGVIKEGISTKNSIKGPKDLMGTRVRETIIQCLKEAESFSDEERNLALQSLVTITKVSPQNRDLLFQTDAAIVSIFNLSRSSDSQITQTLVLSILFNLSLNPNLKNPLAETDTISHLNNVILIPNSIESHKLAASLLCSLSMLDKNKAKFGVSGTIQVLVKAISGPRGSSTPHLLSSLAELVQFHGNCTLAVRAKAVPVLLSVAEGADNEDLTGASLAILGLIARFDEGLKELMKIDRIVVRMVEFLKRMCILSKEGACEILLRLFDASEVCFRDAVRLPEFSSLLADVSVRASGRAREKAGLLMEKVMVGLY